MASVPITDFPTGHPGDVFAAAVKHGVPVDILWGVFGKETSFGKDVTTSSAGAQGDFQFLPSTAKAFGYPLTNQPTEAQFYQQANSAASYLATLKKQRGSWDAALRAYSGGGYGLADVQGAAAANPITKQPGVKSSSFDPSSIDAGGVGGGVGGLTGIGGIGSTVGAITDAFNTAVKDAKYAAVLIVVLFAAGYLIVKGGSGERSRMVPA